MSPRILIFIDAEKTVLPWLGHQPYNITDYVDFQVITKPSMRKQKRKRSIMNNDENAGIFELESPLPEMISKFFYL